MSIAGLAGYMVAIFGLPARAQGGAEQPGLGVVDRADRVAIAALFATFVGWLSVRTEGVYTIMITLAIGGVLLPGAAELLDLRRPPGLQTGSCRRCVLGVDWPDATALLYLALFWALAGYFFIKYLLRAPFGVALQGTRENRRRIDALGFDVVAHRIAAYAVAGVLASIGGVLLTWYNGRSRRDGELRLINILIIAVLGGMRHPSARSSAPSSSCWSRTSPSTHRARALQPRDRHRVPVDRAVFRRAAQP